MERAAHLARLIHLGKKFLSEWEDSVYNRYIRNEQGAYAASPNRNRLRGPFPGDRPPPPSEPPAAAGRRLVTGSPSGRAAAQAAGAISPVRRRDGFWTGAVPAPSGDIDSGDLLLLLILFFFLFREEADEEVLIAIGLLLILKRTERAQPFGPFYVVRIISCHGGRSCPAYC